MTLTPVEIRHVELGRKPLGYDRRATDDLLERIVVSYEETWRERVNAEVRRLRSLESDMRAEYKAFLLRSLDRIEGDTAEHEAPERAA